MSRKQRRLIMILVAGFVLSIAAGLVLYGLRDQIVFFKTPSQIANAEYQQNQRLRVGGLVETDSYTSDGEIGHRFKITDNKQSIDVTFEGEVPDLFAEGEGVVAEGVVNAKGDFVADTIFAKHDETYMPKEVAEALKDQGVWQGDE